MFWSQARAVVLMLLLSACAQPGDTPMTRHELQQAAKSAVQTELTNLEFRNVNAHERSRITGLRSRLFSQWVCGEVRNPAGTSPSEFQQFIYRPPLRDRPASLQFANAHQGALGEEV